MIENTAGTSETNISITMNLSGQIQLSLMVTEAFHSRTNIKQVHFQYNCKDLLRHHKMQRNIASESSKQMYNIILFQSSYYGTKMGNIYYIIQSQWNWKRHSTCVVIFQILVAFALDRKTSKNLIPSTVHIKADFALLRADCHVCVNFYQWH